MKICEALAVGLVVVPLVAAAAAPVTFSENVAPIVYKRCAGCHRPGEAAPFSLLSYDDVAKHGKLIAAVTAARIMPPWKAEPASYAYKDSRRLSDAEIATLQDWVKQGMPKGNMSKAPALPKFPDGWQLGTPDLVVKMEKGFPVPAEGADIYRYLRIPLNLPDDRWVQAIEFRPSAGKVVHHVLFFADSSEDAKKIEAEEESGSASGASMRFTRTMVPLGGIAVGAQPHLLPNGLALKLPKGTDLMFQYHFHPIGKEEVEQSTVGLYFAKKAPEHTLTYVQLPVSYGLFAGLNIAPGQTDFKAHDSYVLPVDVEAISIGAHAHYIGKTMKMTATFPDGTVKTLLDIKDWDFAWQDRYFFEEPILLPKGTKLEGDVTWDNSAENAKNPSRPPIQVTWGEQTKDEMGAVTLAVYPAAEADLATLVQNYRGHVRQVARERIMQDPSMMTKVREILGEPARSSQ
jgi:mono/diheme cytochrome c family protein